MSFEWFIALRYLKAKRQEAFISLITLISIIGVAVGVMALIVVISVMSGFETHLRTKILGINSDILIRSYEGTFGNVDEVIKKVLTIKVEDNGFGAKLAKLFNKDNGTVRVKAATPVVYIQALVTSGKAVSGAAIRGIDPKTVKSVVNIGDVVKGRGIEALSHKTTPPSIILGKELARNLGVGVGQSIQIILPRGTISPVGMLPKIRTFHVTGITSTGVFEYDSSLAFISLKAAQKLAGIGDKVHAIELKSSNLYKADKLAKVIAKTLGFPFWTMDWQQMSRNLFAALKLEKLAMFIVLTLIVLVAAFNIVSTLTMLVMEKKQDIAILKAIGATDKVILRIFIYSGLLIGLIGTAIGVAGGTLLCKLLSRYKFIKIPSEVYYTDTLPILLRSQDVIIIAASAILICFLATIYPARQAARINPSEALRNG